ncbi:Predicted DNA-binding transcriptional regulator YafY, contains an HTH and WYL domains [Nannocystis exedens]|uniref:Predicted DNA-binding transcriptional regulator YafY, contains an HTH and WYL domains n=1 Tax=Nannocystis exedens TaxID=54 RepID=A0A1I2AZG9_9BACT|nr:DNA-binding transcriptional regulator [Nannocystis exedens]SFE49159.1 Predicted DNA-binding transcriptional regulator YafY, contains an HTH and WYL domains [Nannocystis exedens]
MVKASTRVLRLLSLLQARREWPGDELAERLEVDIRTIRRDVDRLRELGYAIEASSGPGGGYRLGAGARTPPLLLDDDEALAVAVALGAAGTVANLQSVALRVLAKLDQLLPSRLRRRLGALAGVTVSLLDSRTAADLGVLTAIAGACRDEVELRFEYGDRQGKSTTRRVQPLRLVHTGRVWYLVAWDLDRESFRTFRVDRVAPKLTRGARFSPRELPEDVATYVSRSIAVAPYRHQARVLLHGSPEELAERVPSWIGLLESSDASGSVFVLGADSADALAALIVLAGVEFTLIEPAELVMPLQAIAARLQRGATVQRS